MAAAADAWLVSVGEQPKRVGPLNLEKTLRVVDAVMAITRASQVGQEILDEWVDRQRQRAQERVSGDPAAKARQDARAARIGELERYLAARDGQDDDETNAARAELAELTDDGPHWSAKLARVLPYLWRDARPELTRLLAVAVIDPADMETADTQGMLDEYIAAQERSVRHHCSNAQALTILSLLGKRVQDEANDEALGEALARCLESVIVLVVAVRSNASAPAGSTGSPATTGGVGARSSSESPSAS